MDKRNDTPETDALVMKAASGGKLNQDEIKTLIGMKYLERVQRWGDKPNEGVLRKTWDLDRRVTALKREQAEKQSLALVKKAFDEIRAKLPGLTFEPAHGTEKLDSYLSDWSHSYRFFIRDGETSIVLKISERISGEAGYGHRNPLGTFDCHVGNWDDMRRFAARKSGIPVDAIVEEIQTKLAAEKKRRAAESNRRRKHGDANRWAVELHKELGIQPCEYGDGPAHIKVDENGGVTVRLPEKMTREQAEKLLRFAKELGL